MFSFWPSLLGVLGIVGLIIRWWLRRSARQEGREEVKLANLEGESDAQQKAHQARNWWHVDPAALKRMHYKYRRKRKDGL